MELEWCTNSHVMSGDMSDSNMTFRLLFCTLTAIGLIVTSGLILSLHQAPQYPAGEGNSLSDHLSIRKLREFWKSVLPRKNQKPLHYRLPSDNAIDGLTELTLSKVYWVYINMIQVRCKKITRMGSIGDGGKEICIDDAYKPRGQCLVYSFGSNFQFDFELDVLKNYDCEIHTFDPSSTVGTIPEDINFHYIGLSGYDTRNKDNWHMQTLSTFRKALHHTNRVIDILKIDIEGGEWAALSQMIRSGDLKHVKQLCLEVHFGWGDMSKKEDLKLLRQLYEEGFRIFMFEHTVNSESVHTMLNLTITNVNEISLVNIKWDDRRQNMTRS